jgi:hypothetical protein
MCERRLPIRESLTIAIGIVALALTNGANSKELKPTAQMLCDAKHSKSAAEILEAEGAIVAFHFRQSNGTLQFCIIPYQGNMINRGCGDFPWQDLPQSVACHSGKG